MQRLDKIESNLLGVTTVLSEKAKQYPAFKAGDKIIVRSKIKEGDKERVQAFEGIVIGRKDRGFNSAFTVLKNSHGVKVERVFQSFSPVIDSVQIKRRGKVRAAKLYYLRDLTGKAARIKEDLGAAL